MPPRKRGRGDAEPDELEQAPPTAAGRRGSTRRGAAPHHEQHERHHLPLDMADLLADTRLPPRGVSPAEEMDEMDTLMSAVCKVECVHCAFNYSLPWQRRRQFTSTSSGFVVEGNRILTNAHCVDFGASIKVKRRGSDQKYVAKVEAMGPECDIAMLSVENEEDGSPSSFFAGVTPVKFGSLPRLQDPVNLFGYPIGGDTMSVSHGVVSRTEVTSYAHGSTDLLGVQIDAAVNSGNSGGPAFNEQGECVGIAFQSLKGDPDVGAEGIGYLIPVPVVRHFLDDVAKNGRYTGFPILGVEWQKLENTDLRSACNMAPGQKGVMVRRVDPTSDTSRVLSPGDIVVSFDGVSLACDGTVPFTEMRGERISFSYLVSQKFVGDKATLSVIRQHQQQGQPAAKAGAGRGGGGGRGQKGGRGAGKAGRGGAGAGAGGGKVETLDITLLAPVRLVPFHGSGEPPSYFVFAGLVFTPCTVPYLKSEFGKDYDYDSPVKLLDHMMHGKAQAPDHQVVLLSQVLASEVTIGYEELNNLQVLSVNGEEVKSMKQLVRLVRSCKDEWLSITLDHNQKVVLNMGHASKASPSILKAQCIPSDRSPDLLGV